MLHKAWKGYAIAKNKCEYDRMEYYAAVIQLFTQFVYRLRKNLYAQSKFCILMTISISEIMSKKIETIEEMASVQEAAKKMKDKNVSSLVVIDVNGKLTGLVTERDLVRKVCINDVRTSTVINKEIMSSPLITIDSNSSPSIAAHMMLQTNVKHLLVVDKSNANKALGIITPVDLRYAVLYTDEELKDAIEKLSEGGPPN